MRREKLEMRHSADAWPEIERQFQNIADTTVRRTEQVSCTLEQRQRGLAIVIDALQTMLGIVTEQRLRS